VTWERARSEEQIEYRIREIIEATSHLYETHRFESITFAMIAEEADFTRSNLYRYFNTKEEIFLELLKHDMANWRSDILETLSEKDLSVAEFADLWVALLLKHKRMVKLSAILYTLLEPNVSLEALIAFKRKILDEVAMIVEHLTMVLPFESAEVATEFLFTQLALAIGAYPMTDLTANQKEAMDVTGMGFDPKYFKAVFAKSIRLLLHGLTKPTDAYLSGVNNEQC
jgi:AcrR family transcriptional regulator